MESRRCVLIGRDSLIQALAAELLRHEVEIAVFHRDEEFHGDAFLLEGVDCLFLSVEIGEEAMRKIAHASRAQSDHVRVVLLDPANKFPGLRRELGAHSIVGVGHEQAETIARFWAISLYPR